MSADESIVIRAARLGDVAAMAEIEIEAFSDPWPEAAFRDVLRIPGARATVAVDSSDAAIAYCVLLVAADQGEIANLAVAKRAHRQGLASRLLRDALAFATINKVTAIFLEVRESNAAARALYGANEFQQIGRRRGYYQRPPEDALVLQWTG